jgi:hypothetical protein
MNKRILLAVVVLWASTGIVSARQITDLAYKPPLARPAYESGKGPRVSIDGAHHNFHTADGRYRPFADLLRRDGYRVDGLGKPFSPDSLRDVDVLVVANPLNERNVKKENWSLPTPSAFTGDEIATVRAWVTNGGSLFLIVDHFPFPGAAGELAKAFGAEFSNGWAASRLPDQPPDTLFASGAGLRESAVTRGRANDETVTKIMTFNGSAFKAPKGATPVLVFDADFVSLLTTKAHEFTAETPEVPIEGWCQGAVWGAGKGRVAVFGEAAMFSAQLAGQERRPIGMNTPDAKQNYQLLLNIMHWLTRAKGMAD